MADKSLLTYGSNVTQTELVYYAPITTINGIHTSSMYMFLSKVLPWSDENDPEIPTQDQMYLKNVFKNMFVAKRITSNNIRPVTQRIDWTTGTTYDYYRDDIDMFEKDGNGFLVRKFYVKNRYDQVFKCLWNNNGGSSTSEPFFQPGNYGTNNIFQGADMYKWKYMFTIDAGSKKSFMDSTWIPLPVSGVSPNPVSTSAGCGDIEVINVTNGGSGYDTVNSYIQVVITGDGTTKATGNVTVSGGVVTDVVINTGQTGSNYTYANVSIIAYSSANMQYISSFGTGATAISPVSPVGGHGFDPVGELGCSHVMFVCEFNGSESGYIPTDIDYRQIGILNNPYAYSSNSTVALATDNIYKTCTDFIVAAGQGVYTPDETVVQRNSDGSIYFTATVLSFNTSTNVLSLINITGTPKVNDSIIGNTTGVSRTVTSYSTPTMIPFSGYISYIQNRSSISRSSDGIEQFKFVLGY